MLYLQMETNNNLITKKDMDSIVKTIDEEIKSEYYNKIKSELIKKRKQIKMLEITLEKANKEYDDLISGKSKLSVEEFLFK